MLVVGHRRVLIGHDGVMLILRRPWLALDLPVTPPILAHLPYGSTGPMKAELRCGLIPHAHLKAIMDHFRATLPDEAAAFVIVRDRFEIEGMEVEMEEMEKQLCGTSKGKLEPYIRLWSELGPSTLPSNL